VGCWGRAQTGGGGGGNLGRPHFTTNPQGQAPLKIPWDGSLVPLLSLASPFPSRPKRFLASRSRTFCRFGGDQFAGDFETIKNGAPSELDETAVDLFHLLASCLFFVLESAR